MMGDEQLASLVLESFINDFPNHIEALWTSLSSSDLSHMESQIFSLKGASSAIPSPMLKRAIDNLSIAVDHFGPKEIEHALNDLELAFQKLITNILSWKSA